MMELAILSYTVEMVTRVAAHTSSDMWSLWVRSTSASGCNRPWIASSSHNLTDRQAV